ncbi:MAG TPA: ribonuclease HII [Actinomycetota bacterium]|nr:ribonuclease HII [Actinomycetota bacterium]
MTMDRYERLLTAHGFTRVAGADEAGRGALAGPLVAAAVILPLDFDIEGINDSKLLTEAQREAAYERIADRASWVVSKAEPGAIDTRGLHRSNIALLRRAAKALEPDYVLTDGFPVPRIPCPSIGVKKGDMVSVSIAAASIMAKVTRDRIMRRLHKRYPAFGFDHNKGYGTREHLEALMHHGPTPVHRMSFAPCAQPSLFASDHSFTTPDEADAMA